MTDALEIAGKQFTSRLMIGTGKYRTPEEMIQAIEASGAEIITVAIRRLDLSNPTQKTILDHIDWERYTILPNTAGARTADEAVVTAKLARELTGSDWVKLEVQPDPEFAAAGPGGYAPCRRGACQRRLCRAAVHPRRPHPGAALGRRGLCHRNAARLAHRLRPRHLYAGRDRTHRRAGERTRRRGRRDRCAVRSFTIA